MTDYNFGPAAAGETIVYGAQRPGQSHAVTREEVLAWLAFMQAQGIRRVCCLLPQRQLAYYAFDLLALYRDAFGADNVCWAPVEDFTLLDRPSLTGLILPFLDRSRELESRVVVHCSAGIGRTGQVLAAWLVHARGFTPPEAIRAVMQTPAERSPYEAVHTGRVSEQDLLSLLDGLR